MSAFDLEAVRQWEDFPLPADRDKWPALMNQIRSDVSTLCDYVVELATEAERDALRKEYAKWAGRAQVAEGRLEAAEAENARLREALEIAWGLIANANEGNWDGETQEWREAAIRWRDEHWHPSLDRAPSATGGDS
jgi:hypothetical protein